MFLPLTHSGPPSLNVPFLSGRAPPNWGRQLTTFQRMGALSLVACGLVGGFASLAQGGNNSAMAQSSPGGSSASPRAPVPIERKGPVSVQPTAPDAAPVPRRTASGSLESIEQIDSTTAVGEEAKRTWQLSVAGQPVIPYRPH